MSCLFCKIAAGEIPATIVHKDDDIVAFRDIAPKAPTHILVIPVRHVAGMGDARATDQSLLGTLMLAASQIAAKEGLDRSGYRVVVNHGEHGGQTVPHLHLHLLGGRPMTWPPG